MRPPSWRRPRIVSLLGPAFVAGVAYLDPGNVASNMTAGARYGYLLVWVVVAANLVAWLVQYLSAKLGLVTGLSLPEIMGRRLTNVWGRRLYWLQAELVAMATDVAEVVGGAIALSLLFGIPRLLGGLLTGVVSMLVLAIQNHRGAKPFERTITAMMVIIAVGFTAGLFLAPPSPTATLAGLLPRFEGTDSVLLAASIIGATVMPHAIYAHSALTRDRFGRVKEGSARDHVLRATRWDVTIALTVAGSVNLGILLLAASTLEGKVIADTLEGAYHALRTVGAVVPTFFAVGLLASALASTSVGAYAGAEIMHGLLAFRIPLLLRRLITLIPALALLALNLAPTWALVLSQVVLSFGIPFALVPLVVVTSERSVLGSSVNRWYTTVAASVAAALLVILNVTLLVVLVRDMR
ncbi:Nramp family divalent metal transporter [Labilithrix luteola]|uniref:Nramp family divalent metal transporter n=1 Tax=Labilithrix luteola TaxID=1391654 RepID=UPI003B8302BE